MNPRIRSKRATLRVALLGACGGALLVSRSGLASPADVAAAQGLFDEAKKLVAGGEYAAARSKLEESERLDPSPSTEFFLADCYEHLGQTASAWAQFLHVASESKAAGRLDREQYARNRADALAPRLSHLIVSVPVGSQSAGIEIKRDGELVGAGQWGTPVPVDPGSHAVTATAPDHVAWTQTVEIKANAPTLTLEVPPLVPAPIPRAPAAEEDGSEGTVPAAPVSSDRSAGMNGNRGPKWKTVALIGGGAGLVTAGIGGVFGALAISKNNESKTDGCNGNECSQVGYSTRRDAQTDATISSVLVGVGAAAVVGGAVLWFAAPRTSAGTQRSDRSDQGRPGRGGLAIRVAPTGVFLSGVFE